MDEKKTTRWRADKELIGCLVLIPDEMENAPKDASNNLALFPQDGLNGVTSIYYVHVEDKGWISLEDLQRGLQDAAQAGGEPSKVSQLRVACEPMNQDGPGPGFIDIRPSEFRGMEERFHLLRKQREGERKARLEAERTPKPAPGYGMLPESGRPHFDYVTGYGDIERVELIVRSYADNGNLYVGMNHYDPDIGQAGRYGGVTVNILDLPPFHAAIDTENNSRKEIMGFLVQNELGEFTGDALQSGSSLFPVFRFDAEKLESVDPDGFRHHLEECGLEPKAHEAGEDEPIDGLKNAAKERAGEKNKGRLATVDKRREHNPPDIGR